MKRFLLFQLFSLTSFVIFSQNLTQTIKGRIIDEASREPLAFATIIILDTNPVIGTTSNSDGYYTIENVSVGRYDLEISFLGYQSVIQPEVVVTSAKEVVLNVRLEENAYSLNEIVIKPRVIKEKPLNPMATVSARMLSVEEAKRYAGAFDDPARLAASFPGVASSVGNNALVIRGNAPKFMQWKIEGVEIPNPNHFADLGAFGGGGLTALSSNLLANSDFYTGAFPAEYNNALSGVFDINMRRGNSTEFEHSVGIGLIGIDVASEGPLSKKSNASYLVNYRYSTLGLVSSLLPEDAQGTNYQDLSFKLKLPSKNAGLFELWGIGLMDKSGATPETEIDNQNYYQDIEKQDVKQFMGAFGLNHKLVFKNSAYLNSTMAYSTNGIDLYTERLDNASNLQPENKIKSTNYNVTFKSFYNKKISANHTNKTGILVRGMGCNLDIKDADKSANHLNTVVAENGMSALLSAYSASSISLKKWKINLGLNAQLFTLNNNYTIEPRLGVSHQLNANNALSFGYGLHSRIEPINIYFANTSPDDYAQANKNLDFSKAHHFVLAYDLNITEKTHLKIEPYFQYLFNIPVIENSTTSLLNLQNDWFINETYVNIGVGQNYGVDLTLEQYVTHGFYYLVSASIFDSKYKTDTNTWYNTRFNKNFIVNALIGKEFKIGKKVPKLLSLNFKSSILGGDRYSIIDDSTSSIEQDVVYNETTPFTEQLEPALILNFTANYEWNKKKTSSQLSFKILNATSFEEFQGHRFNIKTNRVEAYREALVIPNISYKISF